MELNLGNVRGVQGEQGVPGKDGITPTITENPGNTEKVYKLDITSGDSTFTTPNLIGQSESSEVPEVSGVSSFNGRTGAVVPARGDYTAEMVGAATMEQVSNAIQDAVLDSWEASY